MFSIAIRMLSRELTVAPKQIWPGIMDKVTGTNMNCRLERGVWISWTFRLVYLVLIQCVDLHWGITGSPHRY
jgi:hypothetical protein